MTLCKCGKTTEIEGKKFCFRCHTEERKKDYQKFMTVYERIEEEKDKIIAKRYKRR